MPYFLRAGDGASGDYVSLASDISFASSDTFVIEADIQLASAERGRVWGDSAGFQNRLLIDARTSPATANFRLTTGSVSWTLDSGIDPTDRHTYNVERFANDDIVLKVDGVAQGTTQNLGGTGRIQWLFTSNSSSQVRSGMDLYYLSVSINGSLTNYYDPSATGGTGSILEDTTGSNDGTLNNFPTDDSQWIFYSAGGGYTITLDAGSYSLTGQSVDLSASRNILLESGTYSYSGQDVDLSASRRILLDSSSYSYSGEDLSIKVARKLSLDFGAYPYSGNDVTLTYTPTGGATYTITLDSGAYLISGEDVQIKASRKLAIDAGDYSLSGFDLPLSAGRSISLDSGDYNVIGDAVSLKASRALTIDGGAYDYTGLPVRLTYSGVIISLISDYSVQYSQDNIIAAFADDDIQAEFD